METIKLAIADDQILFAKSLKKVLENDAPDFSVINISKNGKEIVDSIWHTHPDIILMDVKMPVMNGVEAVKIIHSTYPEIIIIMLTTFDDDEYVRQSIDYGACGYLLKDMEPPELIVSIRAAYAGNILLSPSCLPKLSSPLSSTTSTLMQTIINDGSFSLSKKELEMLKLIALGYSNIEIASKMALGHQTVKNYISAIYQKLGVHTRAQAILVANKYNLFD